MTERNPIHIQELQPENIKNVIYEIRGQEQGTSRVLPQYFSSFPFARIQKFSYLCLIFL